MTSNEKEKPPLRRNFVHQPWEGEVFYPYSPVTEIKQGRFKGNVAVDAFVYINTAGQLPESIRQYPSLSTLNERMQQQDEIDDSHLDQVRSEMKELMEVNEGAITRLQEEKFEKARERIANRKEKQ